MKKLLLFLIFLTPALSKADTFGNTAFDDFGNPGTAEAWCSPYSPASNGTVTSMTGYAYDTSGTLLFAIYDTDGSGGDAGTRLAYDSTGVAIPSGYGTSVTDTNISLSVTAGHNYMLCYWANTTTWHYVYSTSPTTNTNHTPPGTWPNWAATFPATSHSNRAISIYATFTPSGAGGRTRRALTIE